MRSLSLSPVGACRPSVPAGRNAPRALITCSGNSSSKASARRGPAPPSAQRRGVESGPLSILLQPFQTPRDTLVRSEVENTPRLNPATLLLVACGGLAAVATDVFSDSLHLLAFIDASAHAWVSTTAAMYPAELQSLVAGAHGGRAGGGRKGAEACCRTLPVFLLLSACMPPRGPQLHLIFVTTCHAPAHAAPCRQTDVRCSNRGGPGRLGGGDGSCATDALPAPAAGPGCLCRRLLGGRGPALGRRPASGGCAEAGIPAGTPLGAPPHLCLPQVRAVLCPRGAQTGCVRLCEL